MATNLRREHIFAAAWQQFHLDGIGSTPPPPTDASPSVEEGNYFSAMEFSTAYIAYLDQLETE